MAGIGSAFGHQLPLANTTSIWLVWRSTQLLPNNQCWLNVHRLVTLTGTDSANGVAVGVPVNTPSPFVLAAGNLIAVGDPANDIIGCCQSPASNAGKFSANGSPQ